MMIALHKNATTTPAVRAQIQQSSASEYELAEHPGSTPSASFALSFACATNQINNLQQERQIV
jgi:hypothetical protein